MAKDSSEVQHSKEAIGQLKPYANDDEILSVL